MRWIVFYPVLGLNSILFSDSLEKIAKNPKKDRILAKNRVEIYPEIKDRNLCEKRDRKLFEK